MVFQHPLRQRVLFYKRLQAAANLWTVTARPANQDIALPPM